ncbi:MULTISPECIES: molybdenum cofactor biosynthesis protein B [Aneurinibacillus]|uniref:Molybdenum cofactor biosynthesis protein B n=1 Tax=Aneurinibacillus thermoaerophilus TaxID=143495 RepID=A0A1G7ZCY4_ANETH|nr:MULTISPECIES: molybdenum cofactor biosynthesis protein B [Aneurinibacillus]AMA73056.1 molybdenum cofactor biosynthesis protein B [Aneurinibacillus sp. XH2]MED0676591.1 molybdenum cofactor biosynthesis protein MoaB [Aneurinibacillus thermoaerophilus]MED0680394.1 molybdenum cofactor biosynthesis protein MoaB [Aneurinibacillus thermoaerophilus]MED0735910.1 molybdenum cofactor biosynthesis protein MoaB [Aneurinibacillus thermoaerophilus]MED0757134.1 molybdenum cofactor biosynthesis protein MoaB
MSVAEHKKEAPKQVGCMIITVSDTRNEETDKSGQLIRRFLIEAGHPVVRYQIVKDERDAIAAAIEEAVSASDVHAILLNGGTGIAKRDVTYEVVASLLEKELPGFGEIFRMLSYTEDIGSAAILSRAIAGVYKDRAIFSMPGSSGAVRLAMSKLIIPELGHVIREIYKK